MDLQWERLVENNPHPGGQEGFRIRARLPWHRQPDIPIKVEITVDEEILWPVERRMVFHDYGEPLEAELQVYSPTEVVAEKLRAVRQQVERLENRGWMRNRARDYYDLWRVIGSYRDRLDLHNFQDRLVDKCRMRDVDFEGAEDFFDQRIVDDVERRWEASLGPLIVDLPSVTTVMEELRPQVETLLGPQR